MNGSIKNNPVIGVRPWGDYLIENFADGERAIVCKDCRTRSWFPKDVRERYCPFCGLPRDLGD